MKNFGYIDWNVWRNGSGRHNNFPPGVIFPTYLVACYCEPDDLLEYLGNLGIEFLISEEGGICVPLHKFDSNKRNGVIEFLGGKDLSHGYQYLVGEFIYKSNIIKYYFMDTEYTSQTVLGSENISILEEFLSEISLHLDRTKTYYDGSWSTPVGFVERSWDNLCLPEKDLIDLRKNLDWFFSEDSNKIYKDLGLPKRRGFMFVGSPGVGKTTTIHIIGQEYNVPVLHIKALSKDGTYITPSKLLLEIYEKAARIGPSIVCFEDMDKMFHDNTGSKSAFLSILDGGLNINNVLTIATTNHPEDIDAAFLQRPSRFDRVYVFGLPDKDSRLEFMRNLFTRVNIEIPSDINIFLDKTAGFSYALLQEIFISACLYTGDARVDESTGARVQGTQVITVNDLLEQVTRLESISKSDFVQKLAKIADKGKEEKKMGFTPS
jgi:hypothetical protein